MNPSPRWKVSEWSWRNPAVEMTGTQNEVLVGWYHEGTEMRGGKEETEDLRCRLVQRRCVGAGLCLLPSRMPAHLRPMDLVNMTMYFSSDFSSGQVCPVLIPDSSHKSMYVCVRVCVLCARYNNQMLNGCRLNRSLGAQHQPSYPHCAPVTPLQHLPKPHEAGFTGPSSPLLSALPGR